MAQMTFLVNFWVTGFSPGRVSKMAFAQKFLATCPGCVPLGFLFWSLLGVYPGSTNMAGWKMFPNLSMLFNRYC